LVELVSIRVSQINGCANCLHLHVRDALLAGETSQRLTVLPAWRDTKMFTGRERAALALAESLTKLPHPRLQEHSYSEAAQHLTEKQLSAVSWLVIATNALNRISIISGHQVPADAPNVRQLKRQPGITTKR
jgi:AhpD family alkylhydroperoxidase